jgi:hypothetical protein
VFASYCGLAINQAKLNDKLWTTEQTKNIIQEMLNYHSICPEIGLTGDQHIHGNITVPEELKKELLKFDFYDPHLSGDLSVITIGVRRVVSKGEEDGRRPSAMRAGHL